MENSLDIAITAICTAGQRELVEASPCVSEIADWCWAFVELAGTLSFVSGRLGGRINSHSNRPETGDGCSFWNSSRASGILSSLTALEGRFESAAAEARTLLAGLDAFVADSR